MATAQVASPSEYRASRLALLEKEKELTRGYDAVAKQRRALPIVEITKDYTFTTPTGKANLRDLFDHRRQLVVKHFMFDPEWEKACTSCSLGGDYLNHLEHLHARDTSVVVVSRTPIEKIEAFKKRMGWTFPWVSSLGTDFNYDFHVSHDPNASESEYNFRSTTELISRGLEYAAKGEQPGVSAFIQGGRGIGEEGKIYHTYSAYARGLEFADGIGLLDLTILGRMQQDKQPAHKLRDEYTAEEMKGSM